MPSSPSCGVRWRTVAAKPLRQAACTMDAEQTFRPDPTGINRLFAAYEAGAAEHACGEQAIALAGSGFRFMMLDEGLLAYSLANACNARP